MPRIGVELARRVASFTPDLLPMPSFRARGGECGKKLRVKDIGAATSQGETDLCGGQKLNVGEGDRQRIRPFNQEVAATMV
jgi:hypothetical protein